MAKSLVRPGFGRTLIFVRNFCAFSLSESSAELRPNRKFGLSLSTGGPPYMIFGTWKKYQGFSGPKNHIKNLALTDSSRGLKSVCKFKICRNFAKILRRRKFFFAHFLQKFCKYFAKIVQNYFS